MKRRIAVVTGSRAEYGILKPLLVKMNKSNLFELKLIVSGMHLLRKYGLTFKEIKKDKFEIAAIVRMYSGDETQEEFYGKSLARGGEEFTKAFTQIKPHILVVFGDRLEPLAATLAAAVLRIPIAHIEGGDKTDSGHIDEPIRHSITRFAHIHFPATEKSAERLVRMGEEPWRIYKVGALGLDSILGYFLIPKKEMTRKFGIDFKKPLIVCVYHPVHLEKEMAGPQMHEVLEALRELKMQTIVLYPNNDPGSQDIINEIRKYESVPFIRAFKALPHLEYISLLKHASVLVGNSSSGIIEAPSLSLPVVNVGSRNVGREHAENVIFTTPNRAAIISSIRKALYDKKFREKIRKCVNPYGDGKASDRILKVLSKIKIDKKLLQKKIMY
jgi:UDP-hydrolysing UDP-N-acetyl-D-glucosamine 2-epimerase